MTDRERTVTTGATGRAEHGPETATVQVSATGRGSSPGSAREAAVERAAAVRDALSNVSHERVRTTGFRTRESRPPQADQAPYEATESLAVDADPANADSVVVAVTREGATVNDVEFSLTEETRRDLRERALADAAASARRQAATLAGAEGLTVGEAVAMTASEVRSGRGAPMSAEYGSAADFQPGPVEITAEVEVVFELVDG